MTAVALEQLQPDNAEQKNAFSTLNREWLEKYFWVEEEDERVLSDPEQHILSHGGVVLIARVHGEPVGAGALIPCADGTAELAKMGVTEPYQGKGIGRMIAEQLIRIAKERGIHKLYITCNHHKLKNAMRLYYALGFKDSTEDLHSRYESGTITLEMDIP